MSVYPFLLGSFGVIEIGSDLSLVGVSYFGVSETDGMSSVLALSSTQEGVDLDTSETQRLAGGRGRGRVCVRYHRREEKW